MVPTDSETEETVFLSPLTETNEETTIELTVAAETPLKPDEAAPTPPPVAQLSIFVLLAALARENGITDAFELGVDAQTFARFLSVMSPEDRERNANRWGTEESRFLSCNGVHRIYIRKGL